MDSQLCKSSRKNVKIVPPLLEKEKLFRAGLGPRKKQFSANLS